MAVCVEAQESSSLPETKSAGPSAHCQGQDVKPANPKADRALIDAVRKSSKGTVNTEPVKRAIAAGADLDAKMQGGYTPLHLAAIYDHKEIAEILIAEGADVNAKNKRYMTPLHLAARSGRKEIAELLIAKGADVNAKDENSLTPLDQAIQRKKIEIANLLRKRGGKRGAVYSIHVAAKGDIEAVKQHLAAGADVNAKTESGWTPLHQAASSGHKVAQQIAELLITKGADVNAKSGFGTPLDEAIRFKRTETADLLRKHGGKRGEELK